MLRDVVSVTGYEPYFLQIRFDDGVEGRVVFDELVPFEGVFAPLRDPSEFLKVSVHPELGVVWPTEPTWIPTFSIRASRELLLKRAET